VVDIDPISGNLCPEAVSRAISERTRAIIPVHMAGWPCDMDELIRLSERNGIHLIEDCSQAHGATYGGRPVGSFGTCSAFSFCQDKIMTTGGEGGIFVTDDREIWRRAWEYKDHGKSWDAVFNQHHAPGFRWLHESFGTNWRMTEMQAAIGRIQLRKLPAWSNSRQNNALFLANNLKKVQGITLSMPASNVRHAWYKFYCMLEPERLQPAWDYQRVIEAINAEGIPCLSGSCYEIYKEKAFIDAGYGPPQALKNASFMASRSLMFLVHPTLGTQDMVDTVTAVEKVMRVAAA
jgi:dTDP-4-amino-4,6-dideoxygalactose transaminase